MSSHRVERIRELLKREIGSVIRREFPVEELGLVSVNDVEVSGDLRHATVYVSILGTAEQQKQSVRRLQEQRWRIQDLVARSVVLKYMPVLRFVVDDSIARGTRVIQILEELERGQETPRTELNP
ncbi:30S ribosome-binding factor RbfA [Limisphaera ngatamarikiensis]|jgi:ribosome-binding factor A|uniref:Ribosome-binding factor A n=1 Tax=Limisphaera ngatamarikiensis TaxID=1324935 RepID=A0A6M1RHF0_9BACT|nr:30S ribosome-binding factor RbfA [Limisphaera ngatamarikiensis]NGO39488.1 30S ribosome-binding factor RbfA [Limisphaera ngatamarikiensis]